MANGTEHQGKRYLIIGIDEFTFEIVETQNLGPRKNQAQLLDWWDNISFSGGIRPEIRLVELKFEDKILDIIIIEDRPLKPYF